MKNDPFHKKNFFPNSICSICNLCLTFLFSGQSQPRKGPLLGSRDNPDVIEIEEVLHLKILQLSINHPSIIPHLGQLMIFRRQNKKLTFGLNYQKGWGLSAKLGKHSEIWGKLGPALQAYALNPCTKFPPNPTSRKVNT